MRIASSRALPFCRRRRHLAPLLGFLLALELATPLRAAGGPAEAEAMSQPPVAGAAASSNPQPTPSAGAPGSAAATLEQCLTSQIQAERSATFVGEMTATPGTAHMSMRIEVQEWMPAHETFHTVVAPGLGVWRTAAPGVKVYRYLKQVTNLTGSALYRASVRFHWLNARGRVIRSVDRRTPSCLQPAPESAPGGAARSAGG
jgi:hypothetical protein